MDDIEQLYQDLIVDHYKHPRCAGRLENPDGESTLLNPLCGDEITLGVKISGGKIAEISFSRKGCSISQASASIMCELLKGLTPSEASSRLALFMQLMKGEIEEGDLDSLGDASCLRGVKRFAARIRCATLSWEALAKVLEELAARTD